MENVLSKAKSKLLALEGEMNELRAFIRTYEKLSSGVDKAEVQQRDTEHESNEVAQEFSSKEEIVNAARMVLSERFPRPMNISDLYQEVTNIGIRVSGLKPKMNFSAKLSTADDIHYVQNEGWYYRPPKKDAPG
jgi:hypothetical protein